MYMHYREGKETTLRCDYHPTGLTRSTRDCLAPANTQMDVQ